MNHFPVENHKEYGWSYHTVVSEWVEGVSLENELAKRSAALNEQEAINILAMVALAMEHTHSLGLPHARISSQHVRYHSVHHIQLDHPAHLPVYKELRRRHTVENFYLPPELQGDDWDNYLYKNGYSKDADIWAIGMMLVEMLTRNKPPMYDEDGRPEGHL